MDFGGMNDGRLLRERRTWGELSNCDNASPDRCGPVRPDRTPLPLFASSLVIMGFHLPMGRCHFRSSPIAYRLIRCGYRTAKLYPVNLFTGLEYDLHWGVSAHAASDNKGFAV